MRGTFIKTLTELAAIDKRIMLLTGDLGYMALEPFAERFPDRFVNVGVAEQNMIGIATGLAEAGFLPFCYSIVTFASLRPYEFIRNGPILHQLPVRIVGVGGGVEYGHNGATHYGLEDIGVMRTQPGLTIIAPADAAQTQTALEKTYALAGPIYYRLGKDDRVTVANLDGRFELGRGLTIGAGRDLLLVSMGSITHEAELARQELEISGVKATLFVISSLNPAPVSDLVDQLRCFNRVMTIEAHYANGGAGSLVAEIIAEHGLACKLTRCAITSTPDGITGSQKFVYDRYGLSVEKLVSRAQIVACEARA